MKELLSLIVEELECSLTACEKSAKLSADCFLILQLIESNLERATREHWRALEEVDLFFTAYDHTDELVYTKMIVNCAQALEYRQTMRDYQANKRA